MVQRCADPDRQLQCQRGLRRIKEMGRVDGAAVMHDGFVVGVRVLGVLGGSTGQGDRRVGVTEWQREAGMPGVLGQGAVVAGAGVQRRRHARVQLEPPPRPEGVVAVGAEQGVDESELRRPTATGHEQAGGLGGLE